MTIEERQAQFVKDMEAAGWNIHEYDGCNFYRGASVTCDESFVREVTRVTKLELIYERIDRHVMVIYPK